MTTIHEVHARDSKVTAVIAWLDAQKNKQGWTDTDLLAVARRLSPAAWDDVAAAAEQHPLSEESRALVVERLAGRLVVL